MLVVKSQYNAQEQDIIRQTLKLPTDSICGQWVQIENGKKYRLFAPLCGACLADPNKFHENNESYIEVSSKFDKIKIYCEQHGERKLRGKAVEILRDAFFGRRDIPDRDETPHMRLVHQLEDYALMNHLRKSPKEQRVYKPVPSCPLAYQPYMTHGEYIQFVLDEDEEFRENPNRFKDLETYMTKYNPRSFRNINVDRDLLSFSDGVLVLSSLAFIEYSDHAEIDSLGDRIARHHIPSPYLAASRETPLFDSLFTCQFDDGDGRLEIMYSLIGRLFFKVNQLDNWQVMPLIVGTGNTGKSSVLQAIEGMFSPGSIGEIDGQNEKTFGLENKYNKEVVFIRDAPAKMSLVLPQETFQKMVTGEGMQISIKYATALTTPWEVPIIAVANTLFDYVDNAAQISRRVVAFQFRKILDVINTRLVKDIKENELASIVKKCIGTYVEMTKSPLDFWSMCPESLREAKDDAMMDGNFVYRFLMSGPDESRTKYKRYYVRQINGKITEWYAFKKVFEAYMLYKNPGKKWELLTEENGPFIKLGYDVVRTHICRGCLAEARSGCCINYSPANRSKRFIIKNMELVSEDIIEDSS